MLSFEEFNQQLTDAYEHLYDLVYLRTHPLMTTLVPEPNVNRKDAAWQMHHLLLNTIRELNRGAQAPLYSREWRRYQLMMLRFVDCESPQAVADQLAISRRHYYRGQETGIGAIASILWNRYVSERKEAQTANIAIEG